MTINIPKEVNWNIKLTEYEWFGSSGTNGLNNDGLPHFELSEGQGFLGLSSSSSSSPMSNEKSKRSSTEPMASIPEKKGHIEA